MQRSLAALEKEPQRLEARAPRGRIALGVDDIDARLGGGLATGDIHELRCETSRSIGSLYGFTLALIALGRQAGPVVWLRDPATCTDGGLLYPGGLRDFALSGRALLYLRPATLRDTLWAAGEALRTGGLGAVVLHIKGNPKAFDLSISRKLMMRARASGVTLLVLRQQGEEQASGAATRWHVAPALSTPHPLYHRSVGPMQLRLTLERNREGRTGAWRLAWNPETRKLEDVPHGIASTHPRLPASASARRADRAGALGSVLAFERAS